MTIRVMIGHQQYLLTKMKRVTFCWWYFQMHFLGRQIYTLFKIHQNSFFGLNWQAVSISLGISLSLNRQRQENIWMNNDPVGHQVSQVSDRCLINVESRFFVIWNGITRPQWVNTLRPRQNGLHFPDEIFKWIFCNKIYEFRLKFHWSLFLSVHSIIFQHWFR